MANLPQVSEMGAVTEVAPLNEANDRKAQSILNSRPPAIVCYLSIHRYSWCNMLLNEIHFA